MSNFQTIVIAIFLSFFVFGVLIFSGVIKIGGSGSKSTVKGKVVIWGTFKTSNDLSKVVKSLNDSKKDLTISYSEKPESNYEQSLIEAFASGNGPDIFFITPDMIVKFNKFVYKMPYQSYPEKTFRDSFIDGADIFLDKDGIVGLPVLVDPLVMYYNKNIFSNEGIATIPQYWSDLNNLNQQLTKRKDDGTILQSMIALGQYDNIYNIKEIISTLFIQKGIPIVQRNGRGGYEPVMDSSTSFSSDKSLAIPILEFFKKFSNVSDPDYSWNRSLPSSLDMFTNGKLAIYLGYASELFNIQSINPNLSFDVSPMLQNSPEDNKRTYGKIYALAVNKNSKNIASAFEVSTLLAQDEKVKDLSVTFSLPPASRTLLADKPVDKSYLFTFFNSALITHSWLDPDSSKTNLLFSELIQNILSNKLSIANAIFRIQGQLNQIINY